MNGITHDSSPANKATVVGGAKERDELAFRKELIAIFDYLMGPADKVHILSQSESLACLQFTRPRP